MLHLCCLTTIAAVTAVACGSSPSLGELHNAVAQGDADRVRLLLEEGADPNQRDDVFGSTPLHLAFLPRSFNREVVELLLEHGADVNAATSDGVQPIHNATSASSPKPGIVELLIQHGADVNAATNEGMEPIHYAASRRDPALLRLLLAEGANPNASAKDGTTPLMHLLRGVTEKSGQLLGAAQLLIAAGASTVVEGTETSPMQLAARRHRPELIELLVQHGADIRERDSAGNSMLAVAAGGTNLSAIEYFAERLGVNDTNEAGQTPLLVALHAERDPHEVIAALLEMGADPNVQDIHGMSALHVAARRGSLADVQLVLKAGADAQLLDHEGRSPLDVATLRVQRCERDLKEIPSVAAHLRDADAVAANLIRLGKSRATQSALQESLRIVLALLALDE